MKRQDMNYHKEQARHGLPGFQGTHFQRGLGGMFKGLLRLATPLLKKGAVELGKTALRMGLSVLERNKRPPRPRKRVSSSSVVRQTTSHKRPKKAIF